MRKRNISGGIRDTRNPKPAPVASCAAVAAVIADVLALVMH